MARRSRGSIGTKRSTSSKASDRYQAYKDLYRTRPNPRRGVQARDTQSVVLARRGDGRVSAATLAGQRVAYAWQTGNKLSAQSRNRRANLRPQRRAEPRLSAGVVPVSRFNEHASRVETTRSVCTRKKEARRAVIIATGHGGINGQRQYKPRRKCK
jgi:hypothetical protein